MLNMRQEQFCLEYARCGNAAEAARLAGYSVKTARSVGQRLLTYVDIKKRLQELAEIAESEKIADIKEMQQKLTEVIRQIAKEEVPVVVSTGVGTSEVQMIEKTASIKEVINAIDKLGRMQGAFTEKLDITTTQVMLVDEVPEDW